mmetsp:Transcript_6686/g.19782  ORF Transcript_6686/g.19782 Transcript_6686/m.19782 type:complete len:99 (+) Transcript_6686:440-736(+)
MDRRRGKQNSTFLSKDFSLELNRYNKIFGQTFLSPLVEYRGPQNTYFFIFSNSRQSTPSVIDRQLLRHHRVGNKETSLCKFHHGDCEGVVYKSSAPAL